MENDRAEHIYLYSNKDGADKDYNLHLVPAAGPGDLWHLNYENGKHGAVLKSKGKFNSPVAYAEAKKEFDKTVREKMTKGGYKPQGSTEAYQDIIPAERRSGIEPQLLEARPVAEVLALMNDPAYMWQEKMDGERRPIEKMTVGIGGSASSIMVSGTNREGLIVPIPKNLEAAVAALPLPSFIIDGEDLGQGRFAAFDLISCPADPRGQRPYSQRFAALQELLNAAPSPCWIAVPTASTPVEARALLAVVQERAGEGLVGKRKDAPYSPGFNSHDQFKFPFIDRATCFVEKVEGVKRSVHIAVLGADGQVVPLKKVTIPANYDVPAVGAIVDIEYLYAYESGGLAQPRYKGVRGDRRLAHCVASQLKFKPAGEYAQLREERAAAAADVDDDVETEAEECESEAPSC